MPRKSNYDFERREREKKQRPPILLKRSKPRQIKRPPSRGLEQSIMMKRSRPPNGRYWAFRPVLDHRRQGTMTQFVRELLQISPKGLSRHEIRERLIADHEFAARLEKNPSSFYGIFSRLQHRQEIRLVNGRYCATQPAPEKPCASSSDDHQSVAEHLR